MKLRFLQSIFFISFLSLFSTVYGQDRKCAANDVMERQIASNPSLAARMIAIEKHTQEFVAAKRQNQINGKKPDNPGGGNGGGTPPPNLDPVTIPVVVHIVYNTDEQNIDDERVTEQIRILNEDFNATNADINSYIPDLYSSAVNDGAKISFCLVEIIRRQTNVTSFSTNDNMKFDDRGGSNTVDPEHKLNIWVCNMSGGILGYAYYPGVSSSIDGVVVLYSAFGITSGNYDLGRTATHEVGHYFNLRHIWGDRRCGNDLVDDTPLHDGANYGCPSQGSTSNCKGPIVEMWMNYMDYTYDQCMYMFSKEQAYRMQATLAAGGPRAGMVQTNPCSTSSSSFKSSGQIESENSIRNTGSFKIYPTITTGNVFMQLNAEKSGVAEMAIYNQAGVLVSRKRFSVAEGINTQEINIGNFSNGLYIVKLLEGNNKHIQKLIVQQ